MTSAFMDYPIKMPLYQHPRTLNKDTCNQCPRTPNKDTILPTPYLEHSLKAPLYQHPRTLNKDTIVPTS